MGVDAPDARAACDAADDILRDALDACRCRNEAGATLVSLSAEQVPDEDLLEPSELQTA